jgi:outer membrane lipoprotein carrier protein
MHTAPSLIPLALLRRTARALLTGALLVATSAHADALDTLREFVREAKTGKASFTQTVTSPASAGKPAKNKTSSGTFEFSRPNRFRFAYTKPFEQLIVADGTKVWIFDPDLNQASSRKLTDALGATPASLLAGGQLDQDFTLKAQPDRDGLSWVLATPKVKDSSFETIRIGFDGKQLAAIDITDNFGQRSYLRFAQVATNVPVAAESFRFTPPAGADVIEQ